MLSAICASPPTGSYFQDYRHVPTKVSRLISLLLLFRSYWESCCYSLSRIRLFATPWTVARQSPLSLGFPRQGYWSGLPFPPSGNLPDPGIEPVPPSSPALTGRFFTIWATREDPLNSPGQLFSHYSSLHSNSGQSLPWTLFTCLLLELKKIIWLLQVLIAACRIFDLCCATQDLSLLHADS